MLKKNIISGLSLRFQVAREIQQVGGESDCEGVPFFLFFLSIYFSMKVARGRVHSSQGKSPAPTS